jgi:Mg-chelatase subunit ChlD
VFGPITDKSAKKLHYVRRQLTKIVVAVESMVMFLESVMNSLDRCSIVSFNGQINNLLNLGGKLEAQRELVGCRSKCSGGTKLWDAIANSIPQFRGRVVAGDTKPRVVIILTDGDDSGGKATLLSSAQVARGFNAENNQFTFVIGLGRDVSEPKLRQFCRESRSSYIAASGNLGELQRVFKMIALTITRGVEV